MIGILVYDICIINYGLQTIQTKDSPLNHSTGDDLSAEIHNDMEAPDDKTKALRERIKSLTISLTDEYDEPIKAWGIYDNNSELQTFGTLGNFSVIKGKAKSKKTFLMALAVAVAIDGDIGILGSQLPPDKTNVIYFDTEQGRHHVHGFVKRVCKLINKTIQPERFKVIALREQNPEQRTELIEFCIKDTPNLGFVVIDGIRDLQYDINDVKESSESVGRIMRWSSEKQIHIVTIIHENKQSNTARGHLGTELMNKAETVLSIEVDPDNEDVSIVKPEVTRAKKPQSFAFTINDEGLPEILEDYENLSAQPRQRKSEQPALPSFTMWQIVQEAFRYHKEYSYGDLITQLGIAHKKILGKNLAAVPAKTFKTICENQGFIKVTGPRGKYYIGEPTPL